MSQQFLKNLECFCVKGVDTTCPAGGFVDSIMTVEGAALTADVTSVTSSISSPAKKLSCTSTEATVVGNGPYYDVTLGSPTENEPDACDFIEEGWTLVVSRWNPIGTQHAYYKIQRKNSDGSFRVFGFDRFILESGVTFRAEGTGLITPPDPVVAKAVDQLLEATSEINSQLGAALSIKPDKQLLEKGTEYDFRFSGSATKVDDETLEVVPTDWYAGDDQSYVYDIIRRNDKNATVTLYRYVMPIGGASTETSVFSGRFDDFSEEGFTLKGTPIPNEDILSDLPGSPHLSLSGGVAYHFTISINDQFANIVMNEGDILPDLTAEYSAGEHFIFNSTLNLSYADKISGDFGLFECEQKLFPSGDRAIDAGFGEFTGPRKETSDLFTLIDEGVFDGRMQDNGNASTLSDNKDSFITPDTIHTEGLFQYKCDLTNFTVRPDHTRLHMRISAPIENYESRVAPLYTVYNIKFVDPSGNLVIKYNDFSLRGDALDRNNNFTTYSTSAETNLFTDYYDWNRPEKAHLYEETGYSLSFSVRAVALDDAFDRGFNEGFEEDFILPEIFSDDDGNNYLALDGAPLSTQETAFINPTDGFRVSAIEICNSGGIGIRKENHLPIRIEIPTKGKRVEQDLLPSFMPLSNFDSSLWPSVSSVWSWSADSAVKNINKCNAETLLDTLKQNSPRNFITLDSAEGGMVADSGKLTLKFSNHMADVKDISKGAFNIAFDQGTKHTWWKPSGAFNVENSVNTNVKDVSFFSVDTLTLKVLAKKAVGSRDYLLDVVGYSDDKLLNRTSASGGFIQDPSGVHLNDLIITQEGQYPVISGFDGNSDQLALGGRALSEREDFFSSSGNDHYKRLQYPWVTGTDFELYEVPLKINPDTDTLGLPKDYTLSSLLEHVYLDIFPIPSGASIAHIALSVRYKPQDGLNMSTYGGRLSRSKDEDIFGSLSPAAMGAADSILNAGSGYGPLSEIKDIPHAYGTPETIKTNYARRWRGSEGTVRGPYDPDVFGFGFENPTIDFPFLSGYFKFDNIKDGYVQSSDLGPRPPETSSPYPVWELGTVSGLMVGSPEIHQNVGWRFASGSLFESQLPLFSGNYTSTDWTALSRGSKTFVGNPMYGKIADAFDRVIRLSGNADYINFGHINTTSGFSIFTRFTPDANVSGQTHNLFNSGVLFSKWGTPSELDFALGYKNGFLCAYATDDSDGSIVEIIDDIPYSGYVYPLNVLLTYNDNQSSGLKLYIDGENRFDDYEAGDFDSSYETPYLLRASSDKFYKRPSDNADLTLGWSEGSGVGMNMLVSEFGISAWGSGIDTHYGSGTNIVESNADRTHKQVTAEDFFDNLRVTFFDSGVPHGNDQYQLWDRVNEDTFHDWQIGDFKYCEFSPAFDQWQKRPNREHIVFHIKHDGSGYSTRNDLSLPPSVDSRVAYHTQIENDFLRFHLSDVPDHFHSVNKRITKSLPRGYKFSERALVVESVIEHHTDNSIFWHHCDNQEGPRLIVSLYGKKQEPYWTEDEPNWGLVNRKIHHVEPSSCIMRLDTTFTYGDLVDTSEDWSIFPQEPRHTEFTEKYFSEDVNDMFVQYDLVYPSGPAFESKIKLHSSHVRMSNCNAVSRASVGSGNLYTFGAFPSSGTLNLSAYNRVPHDEGFLNLNTSGPILVDVNVPSGLPLNVSGAYVARHMMFLYTPESSRQAYLNLVGPPSGQLIASSGSVNFTMPVTHDRISLGDDSVFNTYEEFPNGFETQEEAAAAANSIGLSGSHRDSYFPSEAYVDTNEVQQITLTAASQYDTFDITYNDSPPVTVTVGADDDATATEIQDKLNTIDNLTVSVLALGTGIFDIEFTEPAFSDATELVLSNFTDALGGTVTDNFVASTETTNEVQQITLISASQDDTFDITYNDGMGNQESVTVTVGNSDEATALAIKDALNTIDNLTVGTLALGTSTFYVEFTEPAASDVIKLVLSNFVAATNGFTTIGGTVTDNATPHLVTGPFFPGAKSDWDRNGDGYVDGSRLRGPYVPLFMLNTDDPKLDELNLFTFAAGSGLGIRGMLNLSVHNDLPNSHEGSSSGTLNLNVIGVPSFPESRTNNNIPLFIKSPYLSSGTLPLSLGYKRDPVERSGDMNLYTASYLVGSKGVGSAYGRWYNNSFGSGIEVEDNYLAKIPADNEIRGVKLFGYGSCTGNSPDKAIDQPLATDDTIWRPLTCNEGGIFRATATYTNSGAVNFEGGFGYSGNYYGIRKYTQLLPTRAYHAELTVKTGSTEPIKVPRNFEEWEYGMCGPAWDADGCCTEDCDQNIVYSGVKLIGDDACGVPPSSNPCVDPALLVSSGRSIGDQYGYKVAVKGDLMAVSAPKMTIPEYDKYKEGGPGFVDVPSGGAVFLYRRGNDVAGKKAGWSLQSSEPLMLPVGFRRDYVESTVDNLLKFDDFVISGAKWQIGQEGREFGSSLDVAASGDREVVVVGAPRAKWNREFDEITTSGIPCGTMVIADLFTYTDAAISKISNAAKRLDILWKYFSAPWYGDCDLGCLPEDEQFFPHIEMKTIVVQTTLSGKNYPVVPRHNEWFVHKYINRLDDYDLVVEVGASDRGLDGVGTADQFFKAGLPIVLGDMVSGVKEAFVEAFPYNTNLRYDGTPAIFGLFKEDSGSTAGALQYTDDNNVVHSLYDEFEKFYNEYTFASGVYDQTTNVAASGHLNTIVGVSEDWEDTTVELMHDTFDSGRLTRTMTNSTVNRDFITSGVGQIWGDAKAYDVSQFQIPPHSGGRVYVFEKERDNFNCVQIISSPQNFTDFFVQDEELDENPGFLFHGKEFNDRFGHSVGISNNSEVISVGSPFTNSPCRIYERDDQEHARVYSSLSGWLVRNEKDSELSHFHQIFLESGTLKAQESAYDSLSASDRFQFRIDTRSKPYKLSFKYGYGDIKYQGTRQFLPNAYAPTSRLGWSTAVSDEGSTVAFGAPTDSFNEFEDANVYADKNPLHVLLPESGDSWASYQHAGAVRIFESRKTFDHDLVVEFGRFGNLDRSLHPSEASDGFYDQMGLYFNPDDIPFRKTAFSEIEIPQDAGLAFIITPEIDAASDEQIENIKDWLALGDRNLVLVGNDPVWEENGVYSKSNDVLNKILEKLGSRMRITAAKTKEMSIQDCVSEQDKMDNLYNITPSFQPGGGAGSMSLRGNFYAKGVGDIRINIERDGREDFERHMECPEGTSCDGRTQIINNKCEFPLMNSGDLRAEWNDQCILTVGDDCTVVNFKQNWPLHFKNFTPICDSTPEQIIQSPYHEPVPVLTTAEHIPPTVINYPESSGRVSKRRTVYEERTIDRFAPYAEYSGGGDEYLETSVMSVLEDADSNIIGTHNSFNLDTLIDPDAKNGRDGICQGVAETYSSPIVFKRVGLYPQSILAIAESGRNDAGELNTSKAYIIASQWPEDDGSRGETFPTYNKDKNTEFYLNLLKNDCDGVPRGAHVGGWTGNTSLKNAYYFNAPVDDGDSEHRLANKLKTELMGRGHDGFFQENFIIDENRAINPMFNFLWIANPESTPSDRLYTRIKQWMELGNKRLIITYSAAFTEKAQLYAGNVDKICENLNISSRPFFVPNDGEYFVTPPEWQVLQGYNAELDAISNLQKTNIESEPLFGCLEGYGFSSAYNESTAVPGLWVSKDTDWLWWQQVSNTYPLVTNFNRPNTLSRFVPISGGTDYEKIIWFNAPVQTEIPTSTPLWKLEGEAVIKMPTIPLSGYKLFIDWVSETETEDQPLDLRITNARSPEPLACDYFPLHDQCKSSNYGGIDPQTDERPPTHAAYRLPKTPARYPAHRQDINFVANGSEVTIEVLPAGRGAIPKEGFTENSLPKTVRLLSVSGCPIPILSGINYKRRTHKVAVATEEYDIEWIVRPAYSETLEGYSRPVMHKSEEYCEHEPICQIFDEDGNVVREANLGDTLIQDGPIVVAEEFENFSSFSQGETRSKITLITDSTMIQGQCPHYRSEALDGSSGVNPFVGGNQAFIRSLYPRRPTESTANSPDTYSIPSNHMFDIEPPLFVGEQESVSDQGRSFYFAQKLRGPERGSPAKYHAISGESIDNMTEPLYTLGGIGGEVGALSKFIDNEDSHHPSKVDRPEEIRNWDRIRSRIRSWGITAQSTYGVFPRFSGDFLNYVGGGTDYSDWPGNPLRVPHNRDKEFILDAGIGGGLPDLMKLNNTDYLDLDLYSSGCLGDLFGYSVDLTDNKLVVGTPFNAYHAESAASGVSGIVQWHEIENGLLGSGSKIAEDGGAGAAFYFERTGRGGNVVADYLPWEFIQKIKPSSLNVGIYDFGVSASDALTEQRGDHNIDDANFITNHAKKSDNFGLSVSIDSDMIAVGAPNHDFETLHHHIYSGSIIPNDLNTAFQRKSFNAEFDIPSHSFYDLGDSGVRVDKFDNLSGIMVLNNGAVYNFRHELIDFANRTKEWIFAEKLYSVGYNDRKQREYDAGGGPGEVVITESGTENDRFGWSVAIDRAKRGDSDYTLIGGSPFHDWPTSGNHPTSGLNDAGSAYTFDAMLREQVPSIPNDGSWMDTHVFAQDVDAAENLFQRVYQNITGGSEEHKVSGIIVTNHNGDVFLEVSGFDPSTKGFVTHRPYVEEVKLVLATGTPASGSMNLYMSGIPATRSGNMNLMLSGAPSANVYNSMNLYQFGVVGSLPSGALDGNPSGMNLFMEVPSGYESGIINLNVTSTQTTGNLDLNIRGY